MRICIVSKFPPIEGGIAARTYWQVRRLLEEGHEVAVVTNAGVTETEYLIDGCAEHLASLTQRFGLELYDVSGEAPWHIPSGPDHLERLLSTLIGVLERKRFDVIESGYLVPYGVAAGIAARMSNVPHIVRHGGSDLAKLLPHPHYRALLIRILRDAESVVTDADNEAVLRSLGARTEIGAPYEPDRDAFTVRARSDRPGPRVHAYIGKINYHWRRRGLDAVVLWAKSHDPQECRLRIIGQGRGAADFVEWARREAGTNLSIERFVPPWRVPNVLAEIDVLFSLSVTDPIQSASMIAAEARAAGVAVWGDLP